MLTIIHSQGPLPESNDNFLLDEKTLKHNITVLTKLVLHQKLRVEGHQLDIEDRWVQGFRRRWSEDSLDRCLKIIDLTLRESRWQKRIKKEERNPAIENLKILKKTYKALGRKDAANEIKKTYKKYADPSTPCKTSFSDLIRQKSESILKPNLMARRVKVLHKGLKNTNPFPVRRTARQFIINNTELTSLVLKKAKLRKPICKQYKPEWQIQWEKLCKKNAPVVEAEESTPPPLPPRDGKKKST